MPNMIKAKTVDMTIPLDLSGDAITLSYRGDLTPEKVQIIKETLDRLAFGPSQDSGRWATAAPALPVPGDDTPVLDPDDDTGAPEIDDEWGVENKGLLLPVKKKRGAQKAAKKAPAKKRGRQSRSAAPPAPAKPKRGEILDQSKVIFQQACRHDIDAPPASLLTGNMKDASAMKEGTWEYLSEFATRLGIPTEDLVPIGVQYRLLHPDRMRMYKDNRRLISLTESEGQALCKLVTACEN